MNTQPTQSTQPERWTREERRLALNAFLQSEEGKRFTEVFSHDCTAHDQQVFLRDAERRFGFDDEAIRLWWDSLRALVKDPQFLALAEPLAQNGIAVDELYDCLPDEFDPLALQRAIDLAKGIQRGRRGVLAPRGFTNTAGWTVEQIRQQLEKVKAQLDFPNASADARRWWEEFETGDDRKLRWEMVLMLAEELVSRRATLDDFYDAYVQAKTENIPAVLRYLDYLMSAVGQVQNLSHQIKESQTPALTANDNNWWLKLAPRMTRVRGWTDEQILNRLEQVKARLDWEQASDEIRHWWQTFESENRRRLALVLRLAEELANRNAAIAEFHQACGLAQTGDVQASLAYLDYLRLTTDKHTYQFVTLDEFGKVVERHRGEARCFVEDLAPGVTLEMVEIPGDAFKMGTADEDFEKVVEEIVRHGSKKEDAERWVNSERPQRSVTVHSFHIGKFAVTQEQWSVVANWEKIERDLEPDPSRFKGGDHPVETVSWNDAKEFCARLTKKTGKEYRLPTEAEWEYACRAGTTTPFAFGETITPEFVNYDGKHPYAKAEKGEYREQTVPVGSLGVANAFGLFDMHGNVWEWCEDVWHDNYEGAPADGSAWLSDGDQSRRVLRGGSWFSLSTYCRSAFRDDNVPDVRYNAFGFRVVVVARTP